MTSEISNSGVDYSSSNNPIVNSLLPISLAAMSSISFSSIAHAFPSDLLILKPDDLSYITTLLFWSYIFSFGLLLIVSQLIQSAGQNNIPEGFSGERRISVLGSSIAAFGIAVGAVLFNEATAHGRGLISQACYFGAAFVMSGEAGVILELVRERKYAG